MTKHTVIGISTERKSVNIDKLLSTDQGPAVQNVDGQDIINQPTISKIKRSEFRHKKMKQKLSQVLLSQ